MLDDSLCFRCEDMICIKENYKDKINILQKNIWWYVVCRIKTVAYNLNSHICLSICMLVNY